MFDCVSKKLKMENGIFFVVDWKALWKILLCERFFWTIWWWLKNNRTVLFSQARKEGVKGVIGKPGSQSIKNSYYYLRAQKRVPNRKKVNFNGARDDLVWKLKNSHFIKIGSLLFSGSDLKHGWGSEKGQKIV